MNVKRTILIQLDTDPQPSVFDRVVAVDAGVDEVFSYGGVTLNQVPSIVHGAIFTRSPRSLHATALFVGGRDVALGEQLLTEARQHMLPAYGLRVSAMLDSNGANTTASAAVRTAARVLDLTACPSLVLGTGPVGQRVVRLLAAQGARVHVGAIDLRLAEEACAAVRARHPAAYLVPFDTSTTAGVVTALAGVRLLVAAGPPGRQLVPGSVWQTSSALRVAIDLNAVPPAGIEGIDLAAPDAQHGDIACFCPLAIGDLKMKIHRAAIQALFTNNDRVLDAEELYALSAEL